MRWLFPELAGTARRFHIFRLFFTLLTGILILALVSCAANSPSEDEEKKDEPLKIHAEQDGIRLSMSLPKRDYDRTEDVSAHLEVKNISSKPVILHFGNSQHFDLSAEGAGNEEVFRWSNNRVFLQVLEQKRLNPGEKLEEDLVWPGQLGAKAPPRLPGSYTLIGVSKAREANGLEIKGDISIQ